MRLEIVSDGAELAHRAADLICETVAAKPDGLLGLPTGETPIETYAELQRRTDAGACDFSRATIYALDEFSGARRDTPGTNSAFYRRYVRLGQRALHCPNPSARDAEEHIVAYAAALRRAGGLDLCVLGIGENGHIAFNEPGSACDSRARAVELTAVSRRAHAGAFGGLDKVPERGVTLGVADILESRAILVLATGERKAGIAARAIEGPPSADVPASWLQSHENATWLLDAAAAQGLRRSP